MTEIINVGCKGCASNGHCGLSVTKHNKECPCAACLVKTMCSTRCLEYTNYFMNNRDSIGVIK